VVNTIRQVFKNVECFVEESHQKTAVVYNMVFYASSTEYPISFNIPIFDDDTPKSGYYGVLRKFLDAKVSLDVVPKSSVVITDWNNPLEKLQYQSAVDHWKIMREIFEERFWTDFF
jgi:hypothetical protein